MWRLHSCQDRVSPCNLGSVHIERVTLRLHLRLRVTHRHRRKVPHSIRYQTHFINVHSKWLTNIVINFATKFPTKFAIKMKWVWYAIERGTLRLCLRVTRRRRRKATHSMWTDPYKRTLMLEYSKDRLVLSLINLTVHLIWTSSPDISTLHWLRMWKCADN